MKRVRVYAYLKPRLKQRLDGWAELSGDSQSEIIEEAIDKHLTALGKWSDKYGSGEKPKSARP